MYLDKIYHILVNYKSGIKQKIQDIFVLLTKVRLYNDMNRSCKYAVQESPLLIRRHKSSWIMYWNLPHSTIVRILTK